MPDSEVKAKIYRTTLSEDGLRVTFIFTSYDKFYKKFVETNYDSPSIELMLTEFELWCTKHNCGHQIIRGTFLFNDAASFTMFKIKFSEKLK